jgi:hypothetical protein
VFVDDPSVTLDAFPVFVDDPSVTLDVAHTDPTMHIIISVAIIDLDNIFHTPTLYR